MSLAPSSARTARLAELDRLESHREGAGFQTTTTTNNRHRDDDDDDDAALFDDGDDIGAASIDRPLPPSNRGYQLLLRMGWSGSGHGLGRDGRGIAEPIRLSTDGSSRLGLGKSAEYDRASSEATAQRRRMAAESQSMETDSQRAHRESLASHAAAVASHVSDAMAALRCDDCNKQYALAVDYEAHLSSYDHNHVVRLKETRRSEQSRKLAQLLASSAAGGTDAASAKEERRRQKEEQMLEAQMKAAAAATAAMQAQSAPPPAAAAPTVVAPAAAPAAPFSMSVKPGFSMTTAKVGFTMMKKPLLKPKFGFSGE